MIINKNLIVFDLEAENKKEAISKLALVAQKNNKVISAHDYINSVLEREKSCTTGVGNGIAIPHGKCKAVKEAMIVFAKCKKPIQWESLDGKPVEMIFLLGVPEQNVNNIHLKILSQLSRKLMNEEFISLLKKSSSVEEIFCALSDIKVN